MAVAVHSAVTTYAEDVLAGSILAGKMVHAACERHLRDLRDGHERGLVFDEAKAEKAIRFFANLRLPDGQNAGQPFILEPWECFIVGAIFGWVRPDGKRRYQYAYVEVARANGKTPLGAGILLYGMTADNEPGAQCYSAATTRDQAKIAFRDATKMRDGTPALAERVDKLVNNLAYKQLGSFLRPLSSDASKMDGLRVHIALADEVHEHPNGDMLSKLRTGMKSSQPLLLMITTAGYDRASVCWEEHDYTVKVLEQIIDDDSRFGFIATLDDDDEWTDESVWQKANPNLGVTVRLETLRQECEQAKLIPGQQNSFKRLRLNLWTEQDSRWLSVESWEACKQSFTEDDLAGKPCYTGIDLSSTIDLTALVDVFPIDDGRYRLLPYFFCPEDGIAERSRRDRVPYDVWVAEGYIIATPGNVVDYDYIRAFVSGIGTDGKKRAEPCHADKFDIKEIPIDRWNSTQLQTQLMGDGMNIFPFSQAYAAMTAPSKEFEKLIISKKLEHNGNPVLTWMISNVTVEQDSSGNIKPSKGRSGEKIDGVVAGIMGLGRALVNVEDSSVYRDRGLLILGGAPEPEEPEEVTVPVTPTTSREEIILRRYGRLSE